MQHELQSLRTTILEAIRGQASSVLWHDLIGHFSACRMLAESIDDDDDNPATKLRLASESAISGEILARAYRFIEKYEDVSPEVFPSTDIEVAELCQRRLHYTHVLYRDASSQFKEDVIVNAPEGLLVLYIDCLLYTGYRMTMTGDTRPDLNVHLTPDQLEITIADGELDEPLPESADSPYTASWHLTYHLSELLAGLCRIDQTITQQQTAIHISCKFPPHE